MGADDEVGETGGTEVAVGEMGAGAGAGAGAGVFESDREGEGEGEGGEVREGVVREGVVRGVVREGVGREEGVREGDGTAPAVGDVVGEGFLTGGVNFGNVPPLVM